jgi:hypothetical protein
MPRPGARSLSRIRDGILGARRGQGGIRCEPSSTRGSRAASFSSSVRIARSQSVTPAPAPGAAWQLGLLGEPVRSPLPSRATDIACSRRASFGAARSTAALVIAAVLPVLGVEVQLLGEVAVERHEFGTGRELRDGPPPAAAPRRALEVTAGCRLSTMMAG